MVLEKMTATLVALLALAVVGCSDGDPQMIPIRGEVIYKGAPLADGMVVYLPNGGLEAQQASGRIQPDGSFELTTSKKGDGVRIGEYNIVVQAYSGSTERMLTREETEAGVRSSEPKLIIPQRYIDPAKSGLHDTVNSEHSGFKRLELTD